MASVALTRPRNLRRRVEVLVPVQVEEHRRRIDDALDLYLADPTAWELGADGEYTQRNGQGPSTQETLSAR